MNRQEKGAVCSRASIANNTLVAVYQNVIDRFPLRYKSCLTKNILMSKPLVCYFWLAKSTYEKLRSNRLQIQMHAFFFFKKKSNFCPIEG